ncbi:MAG: hypothetical protein WBR18_00665 [Anaerolineales bacterium]
MLPIVVLILAGLYFGLYYSGVFEEFNATLGRLSNDVKARTANSRGRLLDGEVERRLKVFEDFLSSQGENPEDAAPGDKSEDQENPGTH